ncbi:MAG: M28 family peptidase, partial [Gemmatimonadetes bacterium]|nr:M28 family peptidase [Gemmatimonadota bacterium]
MHQRFIPALLVVAAACGTPAATVQTAPASTSIAPNAEELRRDMYVFASDSFGGRETGTPYAHKAAVWLAARAKALGLEPAGDSGYFHRVPMNRAVLTPGPIAVTSTAGRTTQLTFGRDVAFLTSLGPGAPLPRNTADAELVFASYGVVDTALKRNDYAGLNVAGKVAVIAGLIPPEVPAADRAAWNNPQELFNRLGPVISRGPAAVVMLLPDSVYQLAAGQFSGNQISPGTAAAGRAPNRVLPMVMFARYSDSSPFVPAGWSATGKSAAMPGSRLVASYQEAQSNFNGYNIVAIARGADPALRNTYVAFGAHYDHIGISTGVSGDSINNGADDDGSGSVTLLAIARGWMQGTRPKRSGLFVWHIGEEKGLFGSDAFTSTPTVPIDSIVAQLNADMIGRNHADSLYIVGPGAAPNGQSALLGSIVDSVNTSARAPFTFNREWDTTTHPERIYYRSDHYNYARKGIPIVFFTTGLHG